MLWAILKVGLLKTSPPVHCGVGCVGVRLVRLRFVYLTNCILGIPSDCCPDRPKHVGQVYAK